mgnify:FL=1
MVNKYLSKSIYITEEYIEVFKKLEEYAQEIDRSQSYVVCEAVREFMEKVLNENRKYIKS